MKQYIYEPQEAGVKAWPSGELRLDGIERTTHSHLADVFVYPGAMHPLQRADLDRLPYFAEKQDRHVFFHCADHETLYSSQALILRCNLRPWNLLSDPNSIPWAWPVADYSECIGLPDGGFKYDVTFQGWLSGNYDRRNAVEYQTRRTSSQVCLANSQLKSDIAQYGDFFGYIEQTAEGIRRRAEFRRSMKESRIALCPESIPGVFPYRYFEALSAGRVPLLIGNEFCFPFEDEIPYAEFTIFLDRDEAGHADQVILQFLASHSDDDLVQLGLIARRYWAKYLDSNLWPKTVAYAVTQKMKTLGVSA